MKPPNMNPDRGLTFVRTIKAKGVAKGSPTGAMAYAESQGWSNVREIVASIKAAVSAEGISDWALPTAADYDFAEFVRPRTILGSPRLVFRHHPARERVIAATSGSTAYWFGERNARPISRLTLQGSTLEPLSVIAMLVVTLELLRSSDPQAEPILSRDLAAAMVQAMDSAFIDPANAGIAGVKPASITNGVTAFHSSGIALANIDADLELAVQALSDAGSDLVYPAWVMRPRTWLYLKRMRGSGGALAYPDLTTVRDGGYLVGFPVVVSSASPSDVGSPAEGGEITLLDPSQIVVVDDGGGALEVSEEASLAMADNPAAPSTLVSMWQTDAAALKATRYVNWARCRPGMAQVIDQVVF